ncbi:hypothetical protein BB021_08270 [Elizabethkingia ursingii]|uniref:Uncharacterized protein n=2 Tax=Elizabethkingia ursingii TaxID=1756150 RepID=A0ABX3N7U6_9FLAO|nr:hypothetical protein BB021_08270 [Elizabethkingia ursingii]
MYLVIDAALNGIGIRNKYEGGYESLEELGISLLTRKKIMEWLLEYENEHYNGFADIDIVNKLDREGREIALMIKNELPESKIEYFSTANMTSEII